MNWCVAETVSYTLFINSGIYTAVDSAQFPASAFNLTAEFSPENARIIASSGDTIHLRIINNDSLVHGFSIDDKVPLLNIAVGDTEEVEFHFFEAYIASIYYDPLAYPTNVALGLAGMIYIAPSHASTFYWNLKEFNKSWASILATGNSVDWANYYPDYFTVNGRSNPNINLDSNARIVGSVGETIHIIIANTGQSVHSLHFHGYHSQILYASESPNYVGRIKDTFPIKSMQTMILELIPDKPGEYPVHDHNLVAVSAGGIYPNGMFLTMLIQ